METKYVASEKKTLVDLPDFCLGEEVDADGVKNRRIL